MRYPKQNNVIRLKSNASPQNFWAGYASGVMSVVSCQRSRKVNY